MREREKPCLHVDYSTMPAHYVCIYVVVSTHECIRAYEFVLRSNCFFIKVNNVSVII